MLGVGDPESLDGENGVSDGPAWMGRALAYQWGEMGGMGDVGLP